MQIPEFTYMHALPRLLGELEQEWQRLGAPIARHLAVPATEQELGLAAEQVGVPLPLELAVWWGWWHNGVDRLQPGTHGGLEACLGPLGMDFLSVAEALAARDFMLGLFPPPDDLTLRGTWWMPTWLPFAKLDAHHLFVDCAGVTPEGTVAVHAWWHTPEDLHVPMMGSFTAMIAVCVAQLKDGAFTCSPDGYWERREPPSATTIALSAFGPL